MAAYNLIETPLQLALDDFKRDYFHVASDTLSGLFVALLGAISALDSALYDHYDIHKRSELVAMALECQTLHRQRKIKEPVF